MKILADENVHIGIINELRKTGFEILFIPEVGLAGCDDLKILEYSERYEMILLSGDKDFDGLIEFGTFVGTGESDTASLSSYQHKSNCKKYNRGY
ncbi:MAG: hypothetical protein E3K29_01655 [Candidatus Brocadia sp.]|nr:hypothetical protein [Candidatus Brocadia sp.]